jgi:rubredoxin
MLHHPVNLQRIENVLASHNARVRAASEPRLMVLFLFGSEEESHQYYCPVCGIELTRSDFDKPERDYYCPFCSTRQTPSLV